MIKRKKGYFSISAVAKMFSIHQQTIRLYEKEGLISPKRSEGNTRLFSEEDIDRLEEIINYTHTMGINLAGVEMILKLQKQVKKMQNDMNNLFENIHGQLQNDSMQSQKIIQTTAEQLSLLKKGSSKKQVEKVQSLPKLKKMKPFHELE
jgi:MerR family transcriptional regulator/heat shock protein HspR